MNHFLKKIPLFSSLNDRQLKLLEDIAIEKSYKKGSIIFTTGMKADGFYVLKSGKVKIFRSRGGKEQILKVFEPPSMFGEAGTFMGENFPANAEAVEDSTILYIPRKQFLSQMREDPDIAFKMLAIVSKRLMYFVDLVESLSLKDATSKIAHYLLTRDKGKGRVEFKTNLVSMELGLTPETVSRTLSKLKSKGIIRKSGNMIEIVDRKALESLS